MIYWLYELLEKDFPAYVRILRYVSFRALGAGVVAFLLSMIFGQWVIRKLLSLKLGQPIRTADEVHKLFELHGKKQGTPTMGGVLILGSVIVSTLLFARWSNPFIWLCLIVTLVLGGLGFWDDYQKVKYKNSKGVSAKKKLAFQGILAAFVTAYLIYFQHPDHPRTMSTLYVPFFSVNTSWAHFDFGWFIVIFYGLFITGFSNAVNLTDGLDGLAIGCAIIAGGTYAIFCYVSGRPDFARYLILPHHPWANEVAIFCFSLVGAGMGFLWYNCFPARVFMGDTGSLAIGGMLSIAAICCRQELALLIVGGVFVMEAASVMLQVGSFKLRGGKRIFKMAPIHHHFELLGWPETKVIVRFWLLALLCAGIGLATLKLR